MKTILISLISYSLTLNAGVVILDGQEVPERKMPKREKPVQVEGEAGEKVRLTPVHMTVYYTRDHMQNIDDLNALAAQTLAAIKQNLKDNICGQEFFGFEPYSCHFQSKTCEFSFQSERCTVQQSLLPCKEGNPRFGRGRGLERDFNFCVKVPGAAPSRPNPESNLNKR